MSQTPACGRLPFFNRLLQAGVGQSLPGDRGPGALRRQLQKGPPVTIRLGGLHGELGPQRRHGALRRLHGEGGPLTPIPSPYSMREEFANIL